MIEPGLTSRVVCLFALAGAITGMIGSLPLRIWGPLADIYVFTGGQGIVFALASAGAYLVARRRRWLIVRPSRRGASAAVLSLLIGYPLAILVVLLWMVLDQGIFGEAPVGTKAQISVFFVGGLGMTLFLATIATGVAFASRAISGIWKRRTFAALLFSCLALVLVSRIICYVFSVTPTDLNWEVPAMTVFGGLAGYWLKTAEEAGGHACDT